MRRNRRCGAKRVGIAGVIAVAFAGVQGSVDLTPGATVDDATSVSTTLSPSYIGMGIEPSNLFAFVGTSSPNTLTNNLLSNLANYTGIPPHIRVGGNTEDTMIYSSDYTGYYLEANPATTSSSDSYIFGPNYFSAIDNLPAHTPVSMGIGMTYNGSDAVNMTVTIAAQAISTLKNVNLVGFEVGNEPDLYIENQFRPSTWTTADYGDEWIARVEAIYTQVLEPNNIGQAFFEAACTATTAAFPDYKIEKLVDTGVATDNGAYLAGWNQHDYYYYVGVSDYTLTMSGLLSLSSTSSQFTEWVSEAKAAAVTGKPYYVREMGSVGPAGIEGISNTFANALWTLNFFLYASTVGVDSVQMHMLQDSYGSPWQPITDTDNEDTFVRPVYYAYAAMNQIIGAKCATQVSQVDLSNYPSNYGNRLVAYAIYDANDLQSLVLMNTQVANSSNTDISSQNFVISLPTLAGKTFYLSTMTADGADATSNVTWNGISYEESGDGSPTIVSKAKDSVTVTSNGTLTISVRDSQAVVANLGSVIGSKNNVVDTKACNALAASTSEGGASSTTSGKGASATFKSTGFDNTGLSMAAVIGIAAGGGVAILIMLALLICCCVRRNRRKREIKREMAEKSNYLPPPGRTRAYANVPQRDSLDSSADDIWMLPLGSPRNSKYTSGSSTLRQYNQYNSGSSTPLKGNHSREGSYGNSLYEPPVTEFSNISQHRLPNSPSMSAIPFENRRNGANQPHVSSNLAQGNAYLQVHNPRERQISQPGRTVPPGRGDARGRPLSQPDKPLARGQGDTRIRQMSTPGNQTADRALIATQRQDRQRRSVDHGEMTAAYAASQGRAPSAPPANSRSLPGSRQPSPSRNLDRNARSAHGHQSRRAYDVDDSIPPVPSLPDSQYLQRPSREQYSNAMPTSASSHYPSHVAGPRQQPQPSHYPMDQYNNEYNNYGQSDLSYYQYNGQ